MRQPCQKDDMKILKTISKHILIILMNAVPAIKNMITRTMRAKLERYPRNVQVETTAACNANCIMCPHGNITREKGAMDFKLYTKIVDDCVNNKKRIEAFFPFLNGELFMAPNWEEYLTYFRKKLTGIDLKIFTNGSLLNDKNINKLLAIEPDLVNISFDGTDKETYERIRRKLRFEVVEGNISELIRRRNLSGKNKPEVSISIIEMEETRPAIRLFQEKWSTIVDKVTVEPFSNWSKNKAEENCYSKTDQKRQPCARLWYNFVVLNSGNAVICCLDYNGEEVLGNIKEHSVEELWSCKRMTELRQLHLEGRFSEIRLCKNCSYGITQFEKPFWWY